MLGQAGVALRGWGLPARDVTDAASGFWIHLRRRTSAFWIWVRRRSGFALCAQHEARVRRPPSQFLSVVRSAQGGDERFDELFPAHVLADASSDCGEEADVGAVLQQGGE